MAEQTAMRFSNASRVMMSDGFRSSRTMSTMRLPDRYAIWPRSLWTAGMTAEPGSIMPSASASAFIVVAVPIVLQKPGDGAADETMSTYSGQSILPADLSFLACHLMVPEPVRSPLYQPLSIGPTESAMAGMLTVAAAISWDGVVLSQPGGQHHAVDGIAEQRLHQPQVGQVAVEVGGRPLAGLLDGVDRELEGDAARLPDALPDTLGELQVRPVAGRQVRTRLGDADERLARLQLLPRQPPVEVPLDVQRGHVRVVGIVEPELRAEPDGGAAAACRAPSSGFLKVSRAVSAIVRWRLPHGRARVSQRARRLDLIASMKAIDSSHQGYVS